MAGKTVIVQVDAETGVEKGSHRRNTPRSFWESRCTSFEQPELANLSLLPGLEVAKIRWHCCFQQDWTCARVQALSFLKGGLGVRVLPEENVVEGEKYRAKADGEHVEDDGEDSDNFLVLLRLVQLVHLQVSL